METVPNTFPALFYGYTAIWIILGAYFISLGFRVSRLEDQLSKKHSDLSGGMKQSEADGSPR